MKAVYLNGAPARSLSDMVPNPTRCYTPWRRNRCQQARAPRCRAVGHHLLPNSRQALQEPLSKRGKPNALVLALDAVVIIVRWRRSLVGQELGVYREN